MDATIIFPHQLFSTSDALKKSRKTFIIRDPLFFIDKKYPVRFHKNKILLHLLSTDSYKSELSDRGYDVQLVNEKELTGDNYFDSFFKKNNINEIHYCDPVDYTITKRLDHAVNSLSITSYKYDTPGFMLQESDVFDHFTNKKSHLSLIHI